MKAVLAHIHSVMDWIIHLNYTIKIAFLYKIDTNEARAWS